MKHTFRRRVASIVCVMEALSLHLLTIPVFAASAEERSAATKGILNTASSMVLKVAIPIAAVGLAWYGVNFFLGDKKAEDAKNRAKFALIALGCLISLFSAIHLGSSIGQSFQWDPNLGSGNNIIEPATVNIDLDGFSGGEGGTTEPVSSPEPDEDGFGGSEGGGF